MAARRDPSGKVTGYMREAGYEPPVMADEDKVVEDLQRDVLRRMDALQKTLARIERIKTGGRR